MDEVLEKHLSDLHSGDSDRQNAAYHALLAATEHPVDWAYDVWDDLVRSLGDKDNHVRAIAAQVLANLARSDPEFRLRDAFDALLNGTRDPRFVTARHTLQSIWKVGLAGEAQHQLLLDGLTRRYAESADEKNGTLIRYDIVVGLRSLYDATGDDTVKAQALGLVDAEADAKYRKKYAAVWRGV
jgi:hypothetical protein